MKKSKSKILLLFMALIMAVCATACGKDPAQSGDNSGNSSNNPNASIKLNIIVANFGFGYGWIEEVAKVYESQNKDVSINVKQTVLPHEIYSQIEGGLDTYDIFFGTVQLFDGVRGGWMKNLNNVYSSTPKGETKTVAEKLGDYAEEFKFNNDYCGMPYILSPTSLVVNYSTLKELYGENYTLPTTINTTSGLIEYCKELRSKDVYAYIDSVGYTDYLAQTWFAQYDIDGYANYWTGKYVDETGEKKDALNGESLKQQGKLEALRVSETLLKQTNGFNHAYATSMSYSEAQVAFCGLGYGFADTKKCVFMPNGAWLENEMKNILIENPQEIGMIKTPIISSIIKAVPDKSIADDAELSALVNAIDNGKSELKGEGYEVSQNDYDYVKNARMIINHNSTAHQCGIVAKTKYPEVCEDFLVFLASDVASRVASSKLKGLTLPYGYIPTSEDGIVISDYVKSVHAMCNDATLLKSYTNSKLVQNGLFFTSQRNNWQSAFINGSLTANKLYQDDISAFGNQWKYLIAEIK